MDKNELPNIDFYAEYRASGTTLDFTVWLARELAKARNHAHTQAYRDEITRITGLTPYIGCDGVVVYTGQAMASEDGAEWVAGYTAGCISSLGYENK